MADLFGLLDDARIDHLLRLSLHSLPYRHEVARSDYTNWWFGSYCWMGVFVGGGVEDSVLIINYPTQLADNSSPKRKGIHKT